MESKTVINPICVDVTVLQLNNDLQSDAEHVEH